MRLLKSETVWCPRADNPDLLVLLRKEEAPPRDLQAYLWALEATLARVVEEAGEGELAMAERRLRDLPMEVRMGLREGNLKDPAHRRSLIRVPAQVADPGTPVREYLDSVTEAVTDPDPMPLREAMDEAEMLSLESFLVRLVG